MKKRVRKGLVWLILSLTLSGCGEMVTETLGDGESTEEKPVYVAGSPVTFDIRPQDDFYGYVNAEDLWNMEVPYGEDSTGGFQKAADQVDEELDAILTELLDGTQAYPKGSCERLILDYYQLCMSGKVTDKAVFDTVFAMIDGADTTEKLTEVIGNLYRDYGCSDLIWNLSMIRDPFQPDRNAFVIGNSGLHSGDLKEIYEKDYSASNYRDLLADTMTGFGVDRDSAYDKADNIVYLWFDIAAETDFSLLEMEELEKCKERYTLEQLQQILTNVDVDALLTASGFTQRDRNQLSSLYIMDKVQLETVNALYTAEHLEAWKDYLKCAFIMDYVSYLPPEYNYGIERKDDQVDEDTVREQIKQFCYFELSPLYRSRYYTEDLDRYMKRMERDIKKAYPEMIRNAAWLSEDGRARMTEKFQNIVFHFGGEENEEHKTDRAGIVGDTVLRTAINANKKRWQDHIDSLHETPDNDEWSMGAQEVNAYYDPSANCIYITAAIMHEPFFDPEQDYFANLGGLGTVICHELSHAFDSNGIKYDADGVFRPEWISEQDNAAFQERVDIMDAHYDEYALLEVYHVNGEKTVAENLADNGGMQCILSLAKSEQDYRNIFESYAKIWSMLYQNKNLIYYLENDVHSPNLVRVNAVLSCFDEFYKTYDVKEEDGMYIPPEKRVKRW